MSERGRQVDRNALGERGLAFGAAGEAAGAVPPVAVPSPRSGSGSHARDFDSDQSLL